MQFGSDRAHLHSAAYRIQDVHAHNDNRTRLAHLAAFHWIQPRPAEFVTFHFLARAFSLPGGFGPFFSQATASDGSGYSHGQFSSPSAVALSHYPQLSSSAAICLAVSSHESFFPTPLPLRIIWFSCSSSRIPFSSWYRRINSAGKRRPRELPIRVNFVSNAFINVIMVITRQFMSIESERTNSKAMHASCSTAD